MIALGGIEWLLRMGGSRGGVQVDSPENLHALRHQFQCTLIFYPTYGRLQHHTAFSESDFRAILVCYLHFMSDFYLTSFEFTNKQYAVPKKI